MCEVRGGFTLGTPHPVFGVRLTLHSTTGADYSANDSADQSSKVSSEALPPDAVVLMVRVRSVQKRAR